MYWVHDLAMDVLDRFVMAENTLMVSLFMVLSASLAISWLTNRRSRTFGRRDNSYRRLQNL